MGTRNWTCIFFKSNVHSIAEPSLQLHQKCPASKLDGFLFSFSLFLMGSCFSLKQAFSVTVWLTRILLCRLGWPQRIKPVFDSRVLGLKACTTPPNLISFFFKPSVLRFISVMRYVHCNCNSKPNFILLCLGAVSDNRWHCFSFPSWLWWSVPSYAVTEWPSPTNDQPRKQSQISCKYY